MGAMFRFFEVVRVRPRRNRRRELAGKDGAVLGMAQHDHGQWTYAVHIFEAGLTFMFDEDELEATGTMDRPEHFYDGTTLRVIVDPKMGEGHPAE